MTHASIMAIPIFVKVSSITSDNALVNTIEFHRIVGALKNLTILRYIKEPTTYDLCFF